MLLPTSTDAAAPTAAINAGISSRAGVPGAALLLAAWLCVAAGCSGDPSPRLTRPDPAEMTLGGTQPFFEAVRAADEVVVFEGLPHPAWEPEALAIEMRRPDLVRLLDHPFYAQPLSVSDEDLQRLTTVALRPESHVRVEGIKLCGGYHPDYAIVWRSGERTSGALICFGCHEWKLFTEAGRYYETLSETAYAELATVLRKYVVNRPQPARGG